METPEPSVEDSPESPSDASPEADDPSGESEPAAEESAALKESAAVKEPAAEAAVAQELPAYKASIVFLVVVTFVNLVADLWSKAWAKEHFESLRPGDPRRFVVLEDHINFIFAKNRGGAWGLLQNETEALRRPFFLIVSVAAIVFIVSLYRKLQPGQTALKWGLPLVLGGALGNLVDRIRYGFVVDFIDVYMQMDGQPKHWPTFNVADISICVGVALMAIDMFTSREPSKDKEVVEVKADAGAQTDAPQLAVTSGDAEKSTAAPTKAEGA